MRGNVVDIGNERQLFLDEDLCEACEGVRLVVNPPSQSGKVVLELDQPYELVHRGAQIGLYSSVMKDGGKVRMWYSYLVNSGDQEQKDKRRVCYAESEDGLHFVKPKLGLVEMGGTKENNAVIDDPIQGACVWIDPNAPPEERYRSQAK